MVGNGPISVISVGIGIRVGRIVGLQPVVTVMVSVGITQRVMHPMQGAVTVCVGVRGQQSFLFVCFPCHQHIIIVNMEVDVFTE